MTTSHSVTADGSYPHVLYSFRRCPYAIRTRMTLAVAGIDYEHREVLLKDKPPQMLQESPKGTVPVLVLHAFDKTKRRVLDESLDIMNWALEQSDPEHWKAKQIDEQRSIEDWLVDFEANFKPNLDAYKYGNDRSPEDSAAQLNARAACELILNELNNQLEQSPWLFGEHAGYADVAVFPFIRQYANVEPKQFSLLNLGFLEQWLSSQLTSELFLGVMQKHPLWAEPDS